MRCAVYTTLAALAALLSSVPCAWARAPAEAIYPPVQRRIRFSHATHKKRPCESCHGSVRRSIATRDRNLPAEAVCRACHGKTTRAKETDRSGDPARCGQCHRGYDGKGPPARTVTPAANLRFGHRLHLERGAGCAACHDMSAQSKTHLPRMATCTTCHRSRGAATRCVSCHLSGKDGRLITRFPSGTLVPRGTLKGDDHSGGFRRRHGAVASANRRYCEGCHAPRTCLRCHAGSLRPMVIHSGDYATRHAQDARRNQPRCRSCHRSQTFCLGCHQRLGVGQETRGGGFRPSTGRKFHPPGFAAVSRGPGHHSYSARRNIRACSSCHRERTCVRCHGTRSLGHAGFSPHHPGFRGSGKCRSLASRNRRVCLKCHQLGDSRLDCR
jgi:hypothetical protein